MLIPTNGHDGFSPEQLHRTVWSRKPLPNYTDLQAELPHLDALDLFILSMSLRELSPGLRRWHPRMRLDDARRWDAAAAHLGVTSAEAAGSIPKLMKCHLLIEAYHWRLDERSTLPERQHTWIPTLASAAALDDHAMSLLLTYWQNAPYIGDEPRPKLPQVLRDTTLERASGRCENRYCMRQYGSMEVDHIVPLARGGTDELANLQALCKRCNTRKSTATQDEFDMLEARRVSRAA